MADRQEPEILDISEIQFGDEDNIIAADFNPEEDAYTQPQPIPDGRYRVKLTLAEENTYEKVTYESGQSHVRASIVCEIVQVVKVPEHFKEVDYEGGILFYSASTTVRRGKNTCTMAGLLKEIGQDTKYQVGTIPNNKQELCKLFDKTLKMEPILECSTWWRAWEKDTNADEDFEGKFLKSGMENFPPDGKGGYQHIIKSKKQGEVAAKAKIKRFIGVETAKLLTGGVKALSTSVGSSAPPPPATQIVDEEEEVTILDE